MRAFNFDQLLKLDFDQLHRLERADACDLVYEIFDTLLTHDWCVFGDDADISKGYIDVPDTALNQARALLLAILESDLRPAIKLSALVATYPWRVELASPDSDLWQGLDQLRNRVLSSGHGAVGGPGSGGAGAPDPGGEAGT